MTQAEVTKNATDETLVQIMKKFAHDVCGAELSDETISTWLQKPVKTPPHCYTRDEMFQLLPGTNVFVHYMGPCHNFYQDVTAPWYAQEECIITTVGGKLATLHMPLDLYNKSWVAYAYKANGRLRPIGCNGFACSCCGDSLLPHHAVFVCPDCGAIICQTCTDNGEVDAHVCEKEEEEELT
jgi:predicted RNA-binding Zn-ribbon protein involved in translation (DUF1610 family)